jgi:transposase
MLSIEEKNMLAMFFGLGLSDEEIANRLCVKVHTIGTTRRAMGLKREVGVHLRPMKKGEKNKNPTKKRKFQNRKEAAILRDYAHQLGGKNMAALAKQHNVTREYVRQIVQLFTEEGVLDDLGFFKAWNAEQQIQEYLDNLKQEADHGD